ncbi:MAG: zinc-ribbon and DUF3426 domain-containing protein [Gammaproteobacteria bacterium]
MITVCPSCHRQFRIYARQLSAANGLVQCGFCGEQFNALHRLHDQPLAEAVSEAVAPEQGTDVGQEEPQFQIPDTPDSAGEAEGEVSSGWNGDDHDLVEEILDAEPEPRPRSRIALAMWITGTLLLLLITTLQVAWFNRDTLLARYPQYLPVARQLCDYLHCELTRVENSSAIVVINRDVRDHPRYQNVLLVNVTIENRSEQTVAYPDILLTLFDTDGRVIGYRQFAPDDYLDGIAAVDAGMRSSQPVHLVLEVAGSADEAVGFEFDFL